MTLKELLELKEKDYKSALALVERTRPVSLMEVDVMSTELGELRNICTNDEEKTFVQRLSAFHGIYSPDMLDKPIL